MKQGLDIMQRSLAVVTGDKHPTSYTAEQPSTPKPNMAPSAF